MGQKLFWGGGVVCLFPLDARMLTGLLGEKKDVRKITDLPRNKLERENGSKHMW